jgi:hypothetical protein
VNLDQIIIKFLKFEYLYEKNKYEYENEQVKKRLKNQQQKKLVID